MREIDLTIIKSRTRVSEKDMVEEALMKDSEHLFIQLQMTAEQLLEYRFFFKGKQSFFDQLSLTSIINKQIRQFDLNYSFVMLATMYGAHKVLSYVLKNVIMKHPDWHYLKSKFLENT